MLQKTVYRMLAFQRLIDQDLRILVVISAARWFEQNTDIVIEIFVHVFGRREKHFYAHIRVGVFQYDKSAGNRGFRPGA